MATTTQASSTANNANKSNQSVTATKPVFTITSLQERQKYWKFLFYGQHGVGKSELGGSACDVPFMQNVLFLSAEKGDLTLQTTDRISAEGKKHLFTVPVDNIEQVSKVKDWLTAHCRARDARDTERLKRLSEAIGFPLDTAGQPIVFNTVIIDTVTELQAFCIYKAKGYSTDMSLDHDLMKTEWSHFNEILDRMQLIMRAYRDLPMHVIFLVQEQYVQDDTKRMVYMPALQGQMADKIQGFVDIVGFLTKASVDEGKEARRLFLQPPANRKFYAKNREASFKEPFLTDPTLLSMLRAFGEKV